MHHEQAESKEEKLWWGELFGLLNLSVAGLTFILLFLALYSAWMGNAITDSLLALLIACGLILAVTHAYFLLGVQSYAESIKRSDLAHTMWMFTGVSLIEYGALITGGIAVYTGQFIFASTLFLVTAPFIALAGLLLIQLAEILWSLPEKAGKASSNAAFFHALAGYMTTSVILAPLGSLMFFLAKIYMWRLLGAAKNDRGLELSGGAVGD